MEAARNRGGRALTSRRRDETRRRRQKSPGDAPLPKSEGFAFEKSSRVDAHFRVSSSTLHRAVCIIARRSRNQIRQLCLSAAQRNEWLHFRILLLLLPQLNKQESAGENLKIGSAYFVLFSNRTHGTLSVDYYWNNINGTLYKHKYKQIKSRTEQYSQNILLFAFKVRVND